MVLPLPDDALMGAMVFGKLPAHGDFIARGVPPAERDAIDAWLAGSLAEARERLGAAFDDAYDRAPPWRFVDAGGGDGRGVAGALAPSIDAVGRRYPIVVMRHALEPDAVAATAEACESLLFDALAGGWTADELFEAVAAIEVAAGAPVEEPPRWWTEGGEDFAPATLSGRRPRAILSSVLTMEYPA